MANEEIKVLTMEGFHRAMQTVDAEMETKLEGVKIDGVPLTVTDKTVNIKLSSLVANGVSKEMSNYVTKEESSNYITKDEAVSKEDLSGYATKEDLARVLEELLNSLR